MLRDLDEIFDAGIAAHLRAAYNQYSFDRGGLHSGVKFFANYKGLKERERDKVIDLVFLGILNFSASEISLLSKTEPLSLAEIATTHIALFQSKKIFSLSFLNILAQNTDKDWARHC